MKFKGVRVDLERAHKLKKQLCKTGRTTPIRSKKRNRNRCSNMGSKIVYPKFLTNFPYPTPEPRKRSHLHLQKTSFSNHNHPLVKNIAKAREINKAHTTFIDTILKHQHRGRIHADINPIRSDQGGTVTGRFSYSNPNSTTNPARNKDLGPMIRSLFLPEENCKWGCFDYSQQEPRLVVHYAATTEPICFDHSVKILLINLIMTQ